MALSAMLPIFFLAFAFICQLSTTTSKQISLDYYDADSEFNIIKGWFKMVKTPLDEKTSMKQLETEAKNMTGKPGSRMYVYVQRAMKSNKCVSGLTRAECLVVLMYTDDGDARAFYKEYNMASTKRNWQPYRIYTTLLMTALGKLAKIDPIPKGATLYRGISFSPEPPTSRRIVWKALTSTSLDIEVAKRFAGRDGIILTFQSQASKYAAKVGKLSKYAEDEVILFPFEAFDFLGADGRVFYFKTSKNQELLKPSFCQRIFDWACFRMAI